MWKWFKGRRSRDESEVRAADLVEAHFWPTRFAELTITERTFPYRLRPDLQGAIQDLLADAAIQNFCAVDSPWHHESVGFKSCLSRDEHRGAVCTPPEYEEINVGEEMPIRCLKSGFWLLEQEGNRFAMLLSLSSQYGQIAGMRVEIAVPNTPAGLALTQSAFLRLEKLVEQARVYRGKILSLETPENPFRGMSTAITVHTLHNVTRDQVILPPATLELLERNVIDFVGRREDLARRNLPIKKGLLFFGPPGTGKTHTIHYLVRALPGHTTLIITAEQVGLLPDYMTLARLLQPSLVVIEDVDLIGRERTKMDSPCEEVMLNKLLNEMDGLREDAAILFVLTTNRPEMLEPALAARPGRVDQAIEFPLPDSVGREKLLRLYGAELEIDRDLLESLVARTEGVSAAFIKELIRRAYQFQLERDGRGALAPEDVDGALQELLFRGGSLNRTLLGATDHRPDPNDRSAD